MLQHIYIKNIALIKEQHIDFYEGLNILSGETGAGKSIIIDAINFALGERFTKELIRTGENEATVEILFDKPNKEAQDIIEQFGFEVEDKDSLLLSRSINKNGRNSCRVNGRTVTLGMIKELGKVLVDVHGQHEHQSLLNPNKHIDLLDRFGGNEIFQLNIEIFRLYEEQREIIKKISYFGVNDLEKARKIDLLKFQIQEIEAAELKKGEEEVLTDRYKILENVEKLTYKIQESYDILNLGDMKGISVIDGIEHSLKNIYDIKEIDSSMENTYTLLESIFFQIKEVVYEIREYKDNMEYDPKELYEIEKRLDLIYGLKRKYGSNIEEILLYYDDISLELKSIEESEKHIAKLNIQLEEVQKKLMFKCEELSKIRRKIANEVESKITDILRQLELRDAVFAISIIRKDKVSAQGIDQVEFMITTNMGEPMKSLAKIASGGEMSRVMLAIKSVLANVDNIDTLIFDEIDTGISGKAAQKVGEKLSVLSKKYQTLCITHLPQIASMADHHYFIEKKSLREQTKTSICYMEKEDQIKEIARMIGGVTITKTTLETAREMIKMAYDKKMAL